MTQGLLLAIILGIVCGLLSAWLFPPTGYNARKHVPTAIMLLFTFVFAWALWKALAELWR